MAIKPTRAEMSALWQCIEDSNLMVRQMRGDPHRFTNELVTSEQERVRAARRAYIKLNKQLKSKD